MCLRRGSESGSTTPIWLVTILLLVLLGQFTINMTGLLFLTTRAKTASDTALKAAMKAGAVLGYDGTVYLDQPAVQQKYQALLADNLGLDPATNLPRDPTSVIHSFAVQGVTVANPVPVPFRNSHGSLIRFPSATADASITVGWFLGSSVAGHTEITIPIHSTIEVAIQRHK